MLKQEVVAKPEVEFGNFKGIEIYSFKYLILNPLSKYLEKIYYKCIVINDSMTISFRTQKNIQRYKIFSL